ncbi:hypothetical protein AMJ40_02000 [candidate division TA06 bacterium DG_26]|uniref:Uncharacterized protein n=1 Tax=candidate division TA06 bacterium DG_26 TaxID=1703771 RepID=A0A0S7WKR7_UNCT6|nr:MAG: hypothetical protein AMJ40_02000 [candidate division TA06 bacterium DG_26]
MHRSLALERSSIEKVRTSGGRLLQKRGGGKMLKDRHKRIRIHFERPSPYPLPHSLLIAFWDR